jgi:DNA-binding transcriptional LysR family regulator
VTTENNGSATFMEVNSIETIKQCVIRGIGITLIPKISVEKEIAQKKLVALSWPKEDLETGIIMIWHKDKWLSPTLLAFMDTVREELKSS